MAEKVDILTPPKFEKSGTVKTLEEAWDAEDWIGTFNLWIVADKPSPSIIYQIRSPESSWAPDKLDVTAGGHYSAGETIQDGLREVKEELGKDYNFESLTYLGRKMHISPDTRGRERHNVVDIFITKDNSQLDSYILQKKEVFALCSCPVDKLIDCHTKPNFTFEVNGIDNNMNKISIKVNADSFPYNWDNYHYKIACLAKRFLKGESNLIY